MKKKKMQPFCWIVLLTLISFTLFTPQVLARDYWQAFSFQEGQSFTFLIEQDEPGEMAFEFSFTVTAPESGQLTAELEGMIDLGYMEMPLYISATGPDDDQFGNVLFQELLDDFMGWMLLAFFSPSLFLLEVPAITVEVDETGEWMNIPVEAQQVLLEDGAILERSFELIDEDGNFLETVALVFHVEKTQVESLDRIANEMVSFDGYLVKTDLGSALEEEQDIYAEITLVPEFPLPVRIFFDQVAEDPEFGTLQTKAAIRISEFILP